MITTMYCGQYGYLKIIYCARTSYQDSSFLLDMKNRTAEIPPNRSQEHKSSWIQRRLDLDRPVQVGMVCSLQLQHH